MGRAPPTDDDVPAAERKHDLPDDLGVELADLDAVREEARLRAHLLLSEGYRVGQDRRKWMIDVVDANGKHVLGISLADAVSG